MTRFSAPALMTLLLLSAASGLAQQAQPSQRFHVDLERTLAVENERGSDPRVDYRSLVFFGPWDDRNYELTLEDLALLSADEAELGDPVPAFFRIAMRRARPDLPTSGPAQYPRSALQIFKQMYGGYLVDGKIYRKTTFDDDRFAVILDAGIDKGLFDEEGLDAFSGESRVTSPTGAAESAIKISPADPNLVVAGTNGPVGGQRMHWSTDGGATWTQVNLPLGGTCCDPAVDWSSSGQFAYTTALGNCGFFGCQVWFYRSDDGGKTWNDLEDITPGSPRRTIATQSADKEYLHVDQFAGSPYKDNIYVTWHRSNIMQFAVSTDLGNTWATQQFSSNSVDRGIGSDITTDRNGNVYYLWPGVNSRTIRLAKSTNGGQSFQPVKVVALTQGSFDFPIPSMETRRVFMYLAADSDRSEGPYSNSVYAAWTDTTGPEAGSPSANHARIQVGYSRDGGDTWSVSTPHETADALEVDRWHPWLAVGPDGTVHVVFYDTRRDPTRESVDLFYSYSTDGAQGWSTPERVTTVISPDIVDGFEFGDYNGMDIVMDQLIAIFTDNRRESGGTGDSVDVYAAGITPGGGAFCGNTQVEPGEACDGVNLGGQSCLDFGCSGGTLNCLGDCSGVDTSGCTGCAGASVGSVPDGGRFIAGTPLLVSKAAAGADLTLDWDAACGGSSDYAIYEGELGVPESQVPLQCSTGGVTAATISPSPGLRFFLVVAQSGGVEGSYGFDSTGTERVPSASACATQAIAACP